jgi:serine/threonine-protein kinase
MMRPLLMKSGLVTLSLAGTMLALRPAAGSEPSPEAAAAQALFDEARALIARGKYADAATDLEQSQRLDPGVGTLLNLGDCYEHLHRLASAWNAFLDAVVEAERSGQKDRESEARKRAAALTPRLSRIEVHLPSAPVVGLAVIRDGTRVPDSQVSVPAPVDEGSHTIEVSTASHGSWKTTVVVKGEGTTTTVSIPALSLLEPTPAESERQEPLVVTTTGPERRAPWGLQRTSALVAGGLGLTSVVVGTGFLIAATSKSADANALCPSSRCADPAAVHASQDAAFDANVATGALAAGAAALALGAVLWWTVPRERPPTTALSLNVSAGLGSLLVRGAW